MSDEHYMRAAEDAKDHYFMTGRTMSQNEVEKAAEITRLNFSTSYIHKRKIKTTRVKQGKPLPIDPDDLALYVDNRPHLPVHKQKCKDCDILFFVEQDNYYESHFACPACEGYETESMGKVTIIEDK